MTLRSAFCIAVLMSTSFLSVNPQAEAPPAHISGGVMTGLLITKVMPTFPQEARAKRVSGAVVMHVIIGADGRVETASVVSGPEMLRASYLAAVRQWVYMPFLLNGKAARVDTTVTLILDLGASEPFQQMPAGANGNGDGQKVPLQTQVQDRVHISSGVMAGQLLKKVTPIYPPIHKEDLVRGAVVLHVVIGRDGKVLQASVVSGSEILRANALAAVKQWEYRPYLLEGVPREVDTTVTLNIDSGG